MKAFAFYTLDEMASDYTLAFCKTRRAGHAPAAAQIFAVCELAREITTVDKYNARVAYNRGLDLTAPRTVAMVASFTAVAKAHAALLQDRAVADRAAAWAAKVAA